MPRLLEQRLDRLAAEGATENLRGGYKGLEKESLRITSGGAIAMTPHPRAWGAPLTHPYITTDYSEALPEFITPPFADVRDTVAFLHNIHRFLYHHLDTDEMLWSASMPCAVGDDSSIPIAEYGSSNSGRMKHIYRVGLDYRYGRRMQAIAGVHFNYSLPAAFWPTYQALEQDTGSTQDFINKSYFALIRNFKRLGWMVPFLFGSSPAVCKSFLAGRTTRFRELKRGTFYLPYATSLRMSDIGYKNKNQSALMVSYDSLEAYLTSIKRALHTPYPEYEAIGLRDGKDLIQLSTNVLQIENEYYSFIRPKRSAAAGERPSAALGQRGIEYVEVRALDVNCLSPTGVDIEQLYFIEAFVIFCLLEESALLTPAELGNIEYNELTVALRGREPGLELIDHGERRCIRHWATSICERMRPICAALDAGNDATPYGHALAKQINAIAEPATLPAARILKTLQDDSLQFHHFAKGLSERYAAEFRADPPPAPIITQFDKLAQQSHADQAALEASDNESLEDYIANYLAGT